MARFFKKYQRFQSTLPRGERLYGSLQYCLTVIFQSTLPRGERPFVLHREYVSHDFNPRSHGGSDYNAQIYNGASRIISIHAPTGGATLSQWYLCTTYHIFQSTLPRGERQQKSPNLNSNFCKVVTKIHCFLLFEKLISI